MTHNEDPQAVEQTTLQLELSDPQYEVLLSTKPRTLDMAGQRGGKSQMIGVQSGRFVQKFPRLRGFIAANTYLQLTQSTLIKATEVWGKYFSMTEYHRVKNPGGDFVVDKRPPAHFTVFEAFKDYNNIISFKNGAIIYVGSLDNYLAHDGKEIAWAHLDETKDTKEVALKTVILARLSQPGLYIDTTIDGEEEDNLVYLPDMHPNEVPEHLTPFNPATIHTSPSVGQVDWLNTMFELDGHEEEIVRRITDPEDFFTMETATKKIVIYSTYWNAPNLPRNYIDSRLAELSANEAMKFVYGSPFSKTGSEFYSGFDRLKHVNSGYTPTADVAAHITLDFNVVPYMTLLAAQAYYKTRYINAAGVKFDDPEAEAGLLPIRVFVIQFYKEYCYATPLNSIEAVAGAWREDHAGLLGLDLFYYGDASGNNRIEGLGSLTRFKLLVRELEDYIAPGSNRVGKFNVRLLTRRDMVNRLLEGKHPDIELYFDESMIETTKDMQYVKLGPEGKLKELVKDPLTGGKYQKLGHTSDAVDYLLCELLKYLFND